MIAPRAAEPAAPPPDVAAPPFDRAAWAWYGFMMALAISVAFVLSGLHRGLTGDTLWHLADGRWILAHGRLPRTNPFGWSTGQTPWINIEWGWDVASAWLVDTFGPVGLSVWLVGMVGIIAWSQHRRWQALGIRPLAQGDWIFFTLVLTAIGWAWRPQLVSYACFPLWCATIAAGTRHPRRWWWLLPELLVWQTFHGGYLLGLLVWLVAIGDAVWPKAGQPRSPIPWRTMLGVTLGLGLTLGLSPWGWQNVGHAVWESMNPVIQASITEWQSPNFHLLWWAGTIGGPVVLIAGWIYAHPPTRLQVPRWEWLVWAICLGATLLAVRQAPFYYEQTAIIGAGIGLWHPRHRTPPLRARWMAVIVAILGVAIVPEARAWFQTHTGIPPAIVRILRRHPGRIVNGYTAGDGLIALGIPDSLDGRTDLYVATRPDWFQISEAAESGAWPASQVRHWLQAHAVTYVLWPTQRGGTQELIGRPGITVLAHGEGLTLLRLASETSSKGRR